MILLVVLFLTSAIPDSLHLNACYREASDHYPLRSIIDLEHDIAALSIRNLGTRFLPSIELMGQATYHSEVAEIPLSLPDANAPQISRDQYKLAASISQLVYDGGVTAREKALVGVQRDLASQQVRVALRGLREQIDAAFLRAILLEQQRAIATTLEEDIVAKRDMIASKVRGGVALQSDADILSAEIIKVRQQQAELASNRRAALAVLSELIGRDVGDDVTLVLPEVAEDVPPPDVSRRPEHQVFSLQREGLRQQQALAAEKTRPTITGFAETAYGRPPGLNLFENTLTPFVTAGLRIRWSAWDWHRSRRTQSTLNLEQQVVHAREAAFSQQVRAAVQQDLKDIALLQDLLRSDDEIIALRMRVADQAAHRLESGVITATEYLTERNAAHQAALTRHMHRIRLVQSRVRYLTTIGVI